MWEQIGGCQGQGVEKAGEGSQNVQTSTYKQICPEDVIYNMVTIINNTVL